MPLVTLLVCAPALLAPAPSAHDARLSGGTGEPVRVQVSRGRVDWFEGTYEELLAAAAREDRIVFLDFYSRANAYSKKLEKLTYNDARVVDALGGVLCFAIDADEKESKPLRKRFQVQSAPALVFLDPAGTLRDQLSGYFPPDAFLLEFERIRANRDTFSDLRQRIEKQPDDLDARWELACKLRAIGDLQGHEAQVAEIRDRDPDGLSTTSRRMRLDALYSAASVHLDLDALYRFVSAEKQPELLFEGWLAIWTLEGQAARSERDPEKARMHELRHFAAARTLWPLVPEERHGYLGNNIAWRIYECRANATSSDLEFALKVARKAVEAAPDVPAVVDTFACCLWAVGRRDEAIEQVKRCIRLDPHNPEWSERLCEFQKSPATERR